jgi:DNA-binding NarL/FixJ family response regulator/tetratricopeptide (TPR) repeat protein
MPTRHRPATPEAYDPAMVRVASPTFVGRAAELAALDDALGTAAQGRTTTVLIGGDPGVGKSSLLTEWHGRARDQGARVATGVALDLGEHGPSYVAIAEAVRVLLSSFEAADLDALLGQDRSVLARVLPELTPDAGPEATRAQHAQLAQVRLFDRFIDVIDRAATDSPVVLELEDLHWADPSTRAFLLYLVENVTTSRLLVIGTYRPEEASAGTTFGSTLAHLRRRPSVRLLAVQPFTRPEVHDQLTAILGRPPSNALLAKIAERSEGNALFVEELAAAPDPEADLPTSVADATATKAARMSDVAQSVLRVAAVIGRTANDALIRSVAGLEDGPADQGLREAVHMRLLETDHAARGYRFRHALIQEAIYRETLPGERRRLHARVASVMDGPHSTHAMDGALAAQLAHHWYEAGDEGRAFQASLRAGAEAADQSAYAESLGHYERALDVWQPSVDDSGPSRSSVLTAAARSAYRAGAFDKSRTYAERAVDELGETPDPTVQLHALYALAEAQFGLGGTWMSATRLIAELDPEGRSPQDQMLILQSRAHALLEDNGQPAALDLARRVLEFAVVEGDPVLEAHARALVGDITYMQDVAECERELGKSLELAIQTGDVMLEASVRRDLGDALAYSHAYDRLLGESEFAVEWAERQHMSRMARPHFRYREAWALLKLGRLAESVRAVELGLADDPLGATSWLLHLVGAEATTATGDFNAAAAHIEAARDPQSSPEDELRRTYLATVRAGLAFAEHRDADLLQIVEQSLRHLAVLTEYVDYFETGWWLAELGLATSAERAERARAAGDDPAIDNARRLAAELVGSLDAVRRNRDNHGLPDIGTTDRYDALIAGHLARIEGHDDPGLWLTAAEAFPPRSVEALNARYRQAEALLAVRASREDVAAVMASAHATAVEIGARPLAERFEELARRARIQLNRADQTVEPMAGEPAPPDQPPSPGSVALRQRGLSDREIEVLTLVAAGYSNNDIANRLFISSKTASVHVSHILDKLGVTTRTEAATIGVRLGLPEVERVQ